MNAPLPAFEPVRVAAHRLLGDAIQELRSDWRPDHGPTPAQGGRVREARVLIGMARTVLDAAADPEGALDPDVAVLASVSPDEHEHAVALAAARHRLAVGDHDRSWSELSEVERFREINAAVLYLRAARAIGLTR